MIVKNEAPVIQRCLATIKPWISSWVISDTGSDDGTQKLILDFLHDVPGKLIERPWVDFAHNRNEALEVAKPMGDYSLFIDADERFIPYPDLKEMPTEMDYYSIKVCEQASFYERIFLFRNSLDYHWQGVLHEHIASSQVCSRGFFNQGELLSITQDGNRFKDPQKYLKDARVLEEALKKEPSSSRYMFYLGQSYTNASEPTLALDAYQKRAAMEGDDGEKFYSLFMIGVLQEQLGFSPKICAESFLKAHRFRPFRHEPLYGIAIYYFKMGKVQDAYDLLKQAMEMRYPEDSIFVQTHMREIGMPHLYLRCCYELKKYDE
jgi:tetratricopeptide (TPR) repeat protein